MLLKFLQKPITIDFYTDNETAFNSAKPKPAGAYTPNWFKDLPHPKINLSVSDIENNTYMNMRSCVGLISLYQKGVVLPMSGDAVIEIKKANVDGYTWMSSNTFDIKHHGVEQFNKYWSPNLYQHLKLSPPWQAVCSELVPFILMDCYWNRNTQNIYTVTPGLTEFKYQHSLNLNTFFTKGAEDYSFMIENLQPLLHIMPLSERKIKINSHLVDEKDIQRLRSVFSSKRPNFVASHKKYLKHMENK